MAMADPHRCPGRILVFLTKQLQVMLVVPPLAITHGVRARDRAAAAGSVGGGTRCVDRECGLVDSRRRIVAGLARPYIGGSQNNSILELTLGYNGIGRLNGEEHGSVHPVVATVPVAGSVVDLAPVGAYGDRAAGGRGGVGRDRVGPDVHSRAGRPDRLADPHRDHPRVVALVIVARVGRGENGRDEGRQPQTPTSVSHGGVCG